VGLAVAQLLFTCIVSELGRGFAHKSLTLPSCILHPSTTRVLPISSTSFGEREEILGSQR